MNDDGLKLTIYFGERDRVEGSFLADRLLDIFEHHRLAASVLMRGVEGFGIKHHLHTDRLLSLSEDLPLVAVAVDERDRVEAAVVEVGELSFDGLVTLERARIVSDATAPTGLPEDLRPAAKLTLYFGRGRRAHGRPAYEAALDLLRRGGIDGGTVLVGVDGTFAGDRRRARFFGQNQEVPAMLISVGSGELIARALPELRDVLGGPPATLERVQVLKRDGAALGTVPEIPSADGEGMSVWVKLMLYSSEQTHVAGHPVHVEAVRRLRHDRAAGCTALRGIWGYDGRHPPHGDTFWSLRRRVPTLTVVVDAPEKARRWFALLDEITPERGLITSEIVPAFRATSPEVVHGGLRLARRLKL